MGADGHPLGVVSCTSIGSRGSRFGSPVGEFSIWNPVGKYGSAVSDYSAYDRVGDRPPALYDADGNLVAYVSVNRIKFPRVSPKLLEAFLMIHCDNDDGYRDYD
jgi:hypothetical protein